MKVEMSRREAIDFMRACTAMMISFRKEASKAKTVEQREMALSSEKMWDERHELIKNALDKWDEDHAK